MNSINEVRAHDSSGEELTNEYDGGKVRNKVVGRIAGENETCLCTQNICLLCGLLIKYIVYR